MPIDEEKEPLRERILELEKKLYLAEKTIEVKEILAAHGDFRLRLLVPACLQNLSRIRPSFPIFYI